MSRLARMVFIAWLVSSAAARAQSTLEATSDANAAPPRAATVGTAPASGAFDPAASAEKALRDGDFPWYGPEGLKRLTPTRRREIDPGLTVPAGAEIFGWLFLALALVGLAAVLYFVLREWRGGSSPAPTTVAREAGRSIDRVEELPAGLATEGVLDFFAEARKAAAAGDFGRAVVYLYAWELLELDHAHAVRLVKGKTNRQYVRETAQSVGPELSAALAQTVEAFESVYFGGRALPKELFDPLWNRIPEFQRLAGRRVA